MGCTDDFLLFFIIYNTSSSFWLSLSFKVFLLNILCSLLVFMRCFSMILMNNLLIFLLFQSQLYFCSAMCKCHSFLWKASDLYSYFIQKFNFIKYFSLERLSENLRLRKSGICRKLSQQIFLSTKQNTNTKKSLRAYRNKRNIRSNTKIHWNAGKIYRNNRSYTEKTI